MTYKESLTAAMNELARDPAVCFVGYGLWQGRAAGTLKAVPEAQIIETPVAENLMVQLAIGLSLAGRKPVVFIERMDFILNALDAIVNHLDKIGAMSHGEFKPAMILRVVVGNTTKPLFTGKTHVQDFSGAIAGMVTFPVVRLGRSARLVADGGVSRGPRETAGGPPALPVVDTYRHAYANLMAGVSTLLVEYKDLL